MFTLLMIKSLSYQPFSYQKALILFFFPFSTWLMKKIWATMAENTHTFNIDLPVIALYGPHFHTGEDVQK